MVSTTPRPLYPGKRPDTHRTRVWAELGNEWGRARKSLTIPGFDRRTIQHVASHCNDYAILGVHIWDESANYFHYTTCYLLDLLWFLLSLRWVVFIRCCVSFISAMFVPRMADQRMWRHWLETIEILEEETVRLTLRLQQATRLPWKRVHNSVTSNRRITAWEKPDSPLSPDIPLRIYQLVLEHAQQSNCPCLMSVLHKRHTAAHVAFSQLCLRAIMCKRQDEVEIKSK